MITQAAAIRAAFASCEFAKAQKLWEDYAAGIEAAILAGTATEAMLRDAHGLVEWAGWSVKSFHAHATDLLSQMGVAEIYASEPAGDSAGPPSPPGPQGQEPK